MNANTGSRKTLASRAYNTFGLLMSRSERWAVLEVGEPLGYPAAAIASRVAQRAVERAMPAYVEEAARKSAVPSDETTLRFSGLTFETATGRISLGNKLLAGYLLEFAAHWVYALAVYLSGLAGSVEKGPATLVYGIWPAALEHAGSDAAFLKFCAGGPILPLAQAPRLSIQSSIARRSTRPERATYTRQPLFEAHRAGAGRTTAEIIVFLKSHFRALAAVARWSWTCPAACLAAKDLAYHAVAESLDRRGLIASIVTTTSEYYQQPLWMTHLPGRRFRTHMFWFSTNSRHPVYRDEPVFASMPGMRLIRCDEHWVWTEGQKRFLEEMGHQAQIHVAGPLLCYLPEPPEPRPAGGLRVALFDVTPIDPEWALRHGYGETYYKTDTAVAFLEGALEACRKLSEASGKAVEVLLKPKREYTDAHDRRYVSKVRELAAGGRLKIASSGSNLFSFIAGCDAIVVAPFSSPAYVASSLGVPSIYYDAGGQLLDDFEAAPGVAFAGARAGLEEFILKAAARTSPSR